MLKAEICRAISEKLEPISTLPDPFDWPVHTKSSQGYWFIYRKRKDYRTPRGGPEWREIDFFTDESANARLRRAVNTVHEGNGFAISVHYEGDIVTVFIHKYVNYKREFVSLWVDWDDKTAIVLAAAKWLQIEIGDWRGDE